MKLMFENSSTLNILRIFEFEIALALKNESQMEMNVHHDNDQSQAHVLTEIAECNPLQERKLRFGVGISERRGEIQSLLVFDGKK